jgi:hypothetical protein
MMYSAFFLTAATGNRTAKPTPPVNSRSDENIQTIPGTKLEDPSNYRTDHNPISQTVEKVKKTFFRAPK